MIYRSEAAATDRIFTLARTLGIWPGYFYSDAGGWVLTFDPPTGLGKRDYEGEVLL